MKKGSNVIVVIFIACLIAANITATKISNFFGLSLPSSIIIFPIVYIIGDVVTEVYGFKEMKKLIFLGFFANLLVSIIITITIYLPSASFWGSQSAYQEILGQSFLILLASFMGYLAGSLSNSWTMEAIKKISKGKYLWFRSIVSTMIGEGLDTLIFITVAFSTSIDSQFLLKMVITQWLVKVIYEILATPFVYYSVRKVRAFSGIK